ncbi:hypothetical protein RAA17_02915 [Komagataeibacter rhaeticus]|nr:hypothetical protein [Komagataeibacter rhaeticus]
MAQRRKGRMAELPFAPQPRARGSKRRPRGPDVAASRRRQPCPTA